LNGRYDYDYWDKEMDIRLSQHKLGRFSQKLVALPFYKINISHQT
jgi:hypothetical protein